MMRSDDDIAREIIDEWRAEMRADGHLDAAALFDSDDPELRDKVKGLYEFRRRQLRERSRSLWSSIKALFNR